MSLSPLPPPFHHRHCLATTTTLSPILSPPSFDHHFRCHRTLPLPPPPPHCRCYQFVASIVVAIAIIISSHHRFCYHHHHSTTTIASTTTNIAVTATIPLLLSPLPFRCFHHHCRHCYHYSTPPPLIILKIESMIDPIKALGYWEDNSQICGLLISAWLDLY